MPGTPKLDTETPTPNETEKTPLEQLVDEVRTDAQRDPTGYVRETIVPKGGE